MAKAANDLAKSQKDMIDLYSARDVYYSRKGVHEYLDKFIELLIPTGEAHDIDLKNSTVDSKY
jgi:uncharacterized protein YpmB